MITILLFLTAIVQFSSGFIDNTCGTDGTFTCQNITTYSFSNTVFNVANCNFINCGTVSFGTGITANFENVSFTSCGVSDFVIRVTGSGNTLNFTGSTFTQSSFGAVIVATSGNNVYISQCFFSYISQPTYGTVTVLSSSNVYIDQSVFDHTSNNDGGVLHLRNGAIAVVTNIVSHNIMGAYSGNFGVYSNSVLNTNGLVTSNISLTQQGGLAKVSGATVFFTNIVMKNDYAPNGGGIMYCGEYSSCYLNNMTADGFTGSYESITCNTNAQMNITNIYMSNVVKSSRALFNAHSGSMFIVNGTFVNITSNLYLASTHFPTTLSLINVQFINCTTPQGFYINNGGNFVFDGSVYTNSVGSGPGVFVYALAGGSVTLRNSVISNVVSGQYGAVYISGPSYLYIGNNVSFINNKALTYYGGAIYTEPQASLSITGTGLSLSGNTAKNFGNGMALFETDLLSISYPQPNVLDSIYISPATLAAAHPNLQQMFPSATLIGAPSSISFVNQSSSSFSLHIGENIPDFTVQVIDYFGNVARVDILAITILSVSETAVGAPLNGVTMKSIVSDSRPFAVFSGISLKTPKVGEYNITITPFGKHFSPLNTSVSSLTLQIIFTDCEHGVSTFVNSIGACVALASVQRGARNGLSVVAIILTIAAVFSLVIVFLNRENKIIKAASYLFTILIGLGNILGFLSVAVTLNSASCMASRWLQVLAFSIVFSALFLKTYRIKKIFSNKLASLVISDKTLLRIFVLVNLIVIGYLIVWSAVSPSKLVINQLMYNYYVTSDMCETSDFDLIFVVMQLLVQLLLSKMAFDIRHVTADYNESTIIGIVVYNFFIFGGILNLVGVYAVADITGSYTVHAVSVLFPHLISFFGLVAARVGKVFAKK